MYIESKYLERAAHLHKHYPVVDAHLDLAAELYFRLCAGEKHPLRDQYLNDLKAGGFNLIVSSVFLENEQLPEGGLRTSLDQISILLDQIDENEDFLLVRTAEDLEQAIEEDRIGILLYMEGLDCIGNDLHLLCQPADTDPRRALPGRLSGCRADGTDGNVFGYQPPE